MTPEETRAYNREWYRKNRDKKLAQSRAWYADNKDRKARTVKKWRSENRDRVNSSRRVAYWKNPEKARQQSLLYRNADVEKAREVERHWRRANPDKVNLIAANKRAAKLKRTPSWADRDAIRFFYECCPAGYHVDHIIPLQGKLVSGLHIETNLQWLPIIDNIRKGNSFEPESL